MRLAMTLLVRNEAEIVGANIDFHASQGVDLFIVTDNRSTDRTRAILQRCRNATELIYLYEPGDNFDQPEWVTRMARMAAQCGADWVINSDADEFWWPSEGTLRESFSRLPVDCNLVKAARSNFIYVPTEDDGSPFYTRMVYRDVMSRNILGAALPPKVAHAASATVCVDWGNHSVTALGLQVVAERVVEILHFPIRSRSQMQRKVAIGGAALAKHANKSAVRTWRAMYQEYIDSGSIGACFNREVYDKERLSRELKSGRIVRDTRLARHMKALGRRVES